MNVAGEPITPVALAVSVLLPAVAPSVHVPASAAVPSAPVVVVALPLIDPPPDATAKVTTTPETAALFWSTILIVGWTASAVLTVAD